MYWTGWPLERILLLVVAILYTLIFIQVTMYHYRQNFHRKVMWVPVLEAPSIAVAILLYVFYNMAWLQLVLAILFWIAVLSGITGTLYHIRGIGKRVGGYEARNFLIGPPITLPSLLSFYGIIGLLVLYWG